MRRAPAAIPLVIATCWGAGGFVLGADGDACSPATGPQAFATDIGREVLGANDGWASTPPGTTGGSAALPGNVFTVANRQQLASALGPSGSTVARIIYVSGTIQGNVDDNNQPLACTDYYRNGYTLEAYLAAYDPAVWGRTTVPSGPLASARTASAQAQQARIRLDVRSNTTIVGLGTDARLVGINFRINNGVSNVIIRNLAFEDSFDCFPAWDPTDGALGNWNSAYDNISITGGQRIWIDHNSFNDGAHPDRTQPIYFGRPFQWHDGETDITNASDLVTVSWNRYTDHDKTMLIGSSDSATADRGKLRVTIHHNYFSNAGQRTPRDRFGQLHVYNNYYEVLNPASAGDVPSYQYSWGVGVESAIFAENNAFRTRGVTPAQFIRRFNGTTIHATGTLVDGKSDGHLVDVVAAYNAANSPPLADVSWTPTLFTSIDPAASVPALVTCVLGDATGDGWIDCEDLGADKTAVGSRLGDTGFRAAEDVNRDGVVDVRDLAFVSQNLPGGATCH